jgi:integrase
MRDWFDAHPGGIYSICQPLKIFKSRKSRADYVAVTVDESNHHFNATIAGSKWDVVPSWHCFRRSFASNCAARGVDQRLINAWLGHTTTEMQQRYQHFFPSVAKTALDSVFE